MKLLLEIITIVNKLIIEMGLLIQVYYLLNLRQSRAKNPLFRTRNAFAASSNFETATLKIMPRSQRRSSTCIKQSMFSRDYIDFGSRSSPRTCVNNQANHAERCFIHRPVNAPRQDAKFLICREIWPPTGSNRVGRIVEDRYSSEIVNRIAISNIFLPFVDVYHSINYAITSDKPIIALCV